MQADLQRWRIYGGLLMALLALPLFLRLRRALGLARLPSVRPAG